MASAVLETANEAYEVMLNQTSKQLSRMMHIPKHYQIVYEKRQRAWAILAIAFMSARTRLETVLSADDLVRAAVERWTVLVDKIDTASKEEWAELYKEDAVMTEALACLFCPPDIEQQPDKLVTGRDPMAFAPRRMLETVGEADLESITLPDDLLKMLLDREVRRLCAVHKVLVQQWASALEAANWWRACATLDPRPEDPARAREQAMRLVAKLRASFFEYLETFSGQVDETTEADDYDVRAEVLRQNFKMDAITYHRSFETARQRRDKVYRIAESRSAVLK
jgi:hypothetical protein